MDEEIKICECVASEDDWLDINYSQRHYIQEEKSAIGSKRRYKPHTKKSAFVWAGRITAFVLILALLVAMRFVENGFVGEIFASAKSAYSTGILEIIDASEAQDVINIPINVTVNGVEEGTVTIGGGKVLLNFKKGDVVDVTEDTVVVQVDEKLKIVYGGLSKILVEVGDSLGEQAVVGKYVNTASVNLIYDGEVVKDITTVNYTLVWRI